MSWRKATAALWGLNFLVACLRMDWPLAVACFGALLANIELAIDEGERGFRA